MTEERYNELSESGSNKELTKEEWDEGWHFCFNDWDGLLVGPGMPELRACTCIEEPLYTELIRNLPIYLE